MTHADSDLTIRRATVEDAPALDRLWALAEVAEAKDAATVLAHSAEAIQATVFVGVVAGAVVASVRARLDIATGWLTHVAVHPGCRRRSYGRQLVRTAEVWLAEHGADAVHAPVAVPLTSRIHFAHALGYGQVFMGVVGRTLAASDERGDGRDEPGVMLEATVTHLEMTSPPHHPPPHPPAGQRVALMRAERPPVSFYRYLYNTVGERWLWWERRALDDETLARLIQDQRSDIYVLYVDGSPAGFAELEHWRPPTINLAYIGLLPDYLGRGLGRYLLGAILDIAWTHEPTKITVSTNTLDHPAALPLYQRMGFEPVSREVWRMHDPRVVGLMPAHAGRDGT